jgi:hypothetical protein
MRISRKIEKMLKKKKMVCFGWLQIPESEKRCLLFYRIEGHGMSRPSLSLAARIVALLYNGFCLRSKTHEGLRALRSTLPQLNVSGTAPAESHYLVLVLLTCPDSCYMSFGCLASFTLLVDMRLCRFWSSASFYLRITHL